MRFADLLSLAWSNLLRNRMRSILTLTGVMIGVAALLTLLAYGSGLQQTARSEFNALELYNTFRVTSRPNPIGGFGDVALRLQDDDQATSDTLVALTDSLVAQIEAIDGVLAAYPEIVFPGRITVGGREVIVNAEAVPQSFASLPAYQPGTGTFFESADVPAVIIGPSMAKRLGFTPPATAVGDTVELMTATLNFNAILQARDVMSQGLSSLPIGRKTYELRVAGLLKEEQQPLSGFTRVLLPLEQARAMQKVTFFSTLDLLLRDASSEGYSALRVQLTDAAQHASVRQEIRRLGVYPTSFREQFDKLEQLFLVMDLALGIVGFIALIVATIGIANTVTMNVRERYREIGVMMAIGGASGDLQRLFVAESAALGVLGSLIGLLFGWGIVELLDSLVWFYLSQKGIPPLSVFNITPLMVLGIFSVAVAISLVAGFFPARRAARIEPVEALRSV